MSSSRSSAAKKERDAAGHRRRSKQHDEGEDKMVAGAMALRARKKSCRFGEDETVKAPARSSVSSLSYTFTCNRAHL